MWNAINLGGGDDGLEWFRAVLAGRSHLDVDDLAAVALPTLRHRVLLRLESELEGRDVDTVLTGIVEQWRRAT